MTVERSGWAYWVGLITLLMCFVALGFEAYVEWGGSRMQSPFSGDIRIVSIVGTVCYVFFSISLMRQRKSVYFWTVVTTVFTVVIYAMMLSEDPSPENYAGAAIGGFIQLLVLILVLRLMATDRLE